MILVLALALSLAACGGVAPTQPETTAIPTEAPSAGGDSQPTPEPAAPSATPNAEPTEEPADPLMQALLQTLPSIKQEGSHDWRYAITDLDHNGRVEVLVASQHQADRSTTVKLWELSEKMDSLVECSTKLEEGESFPDILSDNADTYYDPATGAWSYLFYDNILLSENEGYTNKCAVTLKDGSLSYQPLAIEHILVQNGQRTVSYMDPEGRTIEAEAFNNAGQQLFFGMDKVSSNFGWFRYEDAVDAATLSDSYAVFTGDKTPDKTNPLPLPQPLDQMPKPAEDASAPLFLYVTKNPTNESREEGKTAYFVAYANIYTSLSWTFVSPEGWEYTPQNFANKFPGVQISGLYSTTLTIDKLPKQANNWGAYCTFNYEGQTARTNTAYLFVKAKAAPTPTPGPTATPAPTTPPTVAPVPTVTPAPVPTGDIIGKGGFSSETGTALDLYCDWFAVRTGPNQAEVTMNVGIRHASIQLNALADNVTLTLGNGIVKMNQPALNYQGGKTSTVFGNRTFSIQLPEGTVELPMNVQWRFKGTYSGRYFGTIECGGMITLENKAEPTPTPEPTPDPEPIYASMAGNVYGVGTGEDYVIVLSNGETVTVDPSVCRLLYGELAEGCSCTVYYENVPTRENIYLVDIYGESPEVEPEPTETPAEPTEEPAPTEEPGSDPAEPDPEPDPAPVDPEPEPEPEPEPDPEPQP